MPPDLPILSERSLPESLPSVMRPYRDCGTVANPRTAMDRALEQEEADTRSSRSPASSAGNGMDSPQLKVQTSSLPPRHASRPAICRYNFIDAGTLTWRVNE
jgi:hypothetical protein